jgi:hypothetical protein
MEPESDTSTREVSCVIEQRIAAKCALLPINASLVMARAKTVLAVLALKFLKCKIHEKVHRRSMIIISDLLPLQVPQIFSMVDFIIDLTSVHIIELYKQFYCIATFFLGHDAKKYQKYLPLPFQ